MTRFLTLIVAFLSLSLNTLAQNVTARADDSAPFEVTLAYSEVHTNAPPGGCGCFWMAGGKAEVNASFRYGISVVAELAGEHANDINAAHEQLSYITYLIGPRYTYRTKSRFVPFAQFLVGGVHGFDAFFPSSNESNVTPDALALAAGGGLNIDLQHYFALRVFQIDYLLTQLPNNTSNRENNLRLSAGIVFRFPSERSGQTHFKTSPAG